MMAYRGLLLDIDGVLTVSWRPLRGAVGAIAELRAAGTRLLFVTNTTSRSRRVLSETLSSAGFEIAASEILTAAAATGAYLRRAHPGARCFVLTSGDVTADLEGVTITGPGEPADLVVIGGAGVEFGYDSLNHAFHLLQQGVPLVAMHRNLYWQMGDRHTLDSGAYILGLEKAAGAHAVVIGKPARAFYEAALASLGLPAESVAVVGDDIDADVKGAKDSGLAGILVRTGKFRQADLERSGVAPDAILDSIADLPAWLRASAPRRLAR
jgi:HAD superfamily hydrolase (TIGR01458 family)